MRSDPRGGSILSKRSDTASFLIAYLRRLIELGEEEILFDTRLIDGTRQDSGGGVSGDTERALEVISEEIHSCKRCSLHRTRRRVVPGSGNPAAGLVMVGEAPGGREDQQGLPFVGASGQLLRRLFRLAGVCEDDYFLLNLLKCRPPGNRDPLPEELEACRSFAEAQLDALQPKLLVGLGRFAGRYILGEEGASLTRMRGTIHRRKGVPVIVTFHPSALLRQTSMREHAWNDIKQIRRILDATGDGTSLKDR